MEVVVGKVGRAHGLGGEVAVEVRTDQPEERFFPGAVLVLEGGAAGTPAGHAAGGAPDRGARGRPGGDGGSDAPWSRPGPASGSAPDVPRRSVRVESLRRHQQRLLVRFEGCADRTAAERLRGATLITDVPEDETPEDPDEFFDHTLIGLVAETTGGEPLGEVHEVLHLPMQDILAVRTPDGGEILVPFVKEIVPEIDVGAGRVLVDPPAGLLPPAR